MTRIILILIFISRIVLFGSVKEEAEETITRITDSSNITFVKYEIGSSTKMIIEKKCKQKFFSSHLYKWNVYKGDSLINIVLLDNVKGKTQPISFLVVFNLEGKVIQSEVVKYREDHGWQVQDESWLNQFKGRDFTSSFLVGQDIDGISGATISVNSLSKGINKLCLLAQEILENE